MKLKLIIIFIFFFSIGRLSAQNCQIRMKVTGIEEDEGKIVFAIFASEEDHLKKPFKDFSKSVSGKNSIEACFNDIPEGRYSISIFQDLDGNGKISRKFYGPPAEPYGFSNNVKGFTGPPSFEDTSFEIRKGESKSMTLKLF